MFTKLSHCRCRRTHPDRVRNNAEVRHDPVSSQVHISSIDINAIRPSLARQGKKDAEIDDMSKINDNDSV